MKYAFVIDEKGKSFIVKNYWHVKAANLFCGELVSGCIDSSCVGMATAWDVRCTRIYEDINIQKIVEDFFCELL